MATILVSPVQDAIGEEFVSERHAYEALEHSANQNYFPALLKLANYEPPGMEELPSDARKVLLESVLEVSEPAFETLLQLAPQ
jgi:hypothetical protein